MFVTIELLYGPNRKEIVSKKCIQTNIDTLKKFQECKCNVNSIYATTVLNDTISILRGIQNKLPDNY